MIDPAILTDSVEDEVEEQLFTSLRAKAWSDFFGQEGVKESLLIAIHAAKSRNEPLDHILLYGPPGLGKTTLSHLIAQELGSNVRVTSGTALSRVGDLAAILTNLQPGDVLFIDEIHRLPKAIEETLYPAMEDYGLDIVIGKGPSARTIRLDLPKFTLVGATTRYGLLAGPFRDRFGLIHRLDYYQPQALAVIIEQAAKKLKVVISTDLAVALAQRSRGTPRVALKLLKRVRDFVQVQGRSTISSKDLEQSLAMITIDQMGLDESDRRLLEQIIKKHNGGPVGLSTIAATLSEDTLTVEEVIEPYLLQIGFLKRTNKGRVVTPIAYAHLGITYPKPT
ncbi:MAG: Holliday junction branch migration DNA helicase RuvB [Candidatus Pacebacteria bacterium CG10_big_fil_rev_8_21_14_0_10_44_11]|nr:MAG: Holliday junction branch migration DNA helicase RuvB [Candidatus Pacebacteria bacterium CG10_big_fil_rev_8_21_14_0_10_44_11]